MAGMMFLRREIIAASRLLPPQYARCDHLRTSGYNARIDIGVPGNDETLEFDFDYAVMTQQNYFSAFGNYESEQSRCWRLLQGTTATNPRYFLTTTLNRRAGSSTGFPAVAEGESVIGKRINFRFSYGQVTVTCGDFSRTTTFAADGTAAVSERNIAFGSSSPTHSGNTIEGRFWFIRIRRNGQLIRNYVPCVRISDKKAGFYDLANHTFNPSTGSVDFSAGYDGVTL